MLRVEPKADAVTEELLAKVVFEHPPEPIPPIGELAEVTVALPAVPAAVVIPNAALRREAGEVGVWQVKAGRLHFAPLTLGATDLDGRVQVRVAQPGEVLGAGGRVLNLIDLSDVYITFFLPGTVAGRVALGSEVRIILDAAPEYVIPATVSFVASAAQFTPKTVETASERQKLMFRVRAQISQELLREHLNQVKTGLPGVAWIKLDANAEWPQNLSVRVPE